MIPLEWIAAALTLVTIIFVVLRSIWTYPFGLVAVTLYFFVFYDSKLYSDALLQIFFFAIQIYGWWNWTHADRVDHGIAVESMSGRARGNWAMGTLVASAAWGFLMHRYTDAAAPFVDAAVAGLSVTAQILQSLRRYECWVLWIAADVVAIGLYAWKGLALTSGLYGLFLILAIVGLIDWRKKLAQ